MKVETYEIEEMNSSEASCLAADGEAALLIERLGLAGQQDLANPKTATRFPYPRMSAREELIYGLCFPERTEVTRYRAGIIPVRVLQVLAFCKDGEFKQCGHMEIWHTATPKEDPILVAREHQYGGGNHLLARWGDSLKTLDELAKFAKPLLHARLNNKLKSAVSKASAMLETVDALVTEAMLTGKEPTPQFIE